MTVTATCMVDFSSESTSILCLEQELLRLVSEEVRGAIYDLSMRKPRAEMLLWGEAYPPGGEEARSCFVRASLGELKKELYVIGDRRWEDEVPTEPEPFRRMPLSWERAFGGEGYKKNPLGRGYRPVEVEGRRVHLLPNVELPGALVTSPGARPEPAGFGPRDVLDPSFYRDSGTYDEAWLKEDYPGLARDTRWEMFNLAPADQQKEGAFRGGEPYLLENLHPTRDRIEGRLPELRARCFLTHPKPEQEREQGAEPLREVALELSTVGFFPHRERLLLVFHGTTEVEEDDGAEIEQLLLALEDLGSPKSPEHYAEVLRRRTDPKEVMAYFLQDVDLLPARLPAKTLESRAAESGRGGFGLLRANLERRSERERQALRARLRAQGVDPDTLPKRPEEEELGELMDASKGTLSLEQLPRLLEKTRELRAKLERQREERRIELERRMAASGGGAPGGRGSGPPRVSAEAQRERLQKICRTARAAGHPRPDLEAKVEDPLFFARLKRQEELAKKAYLKGAHHREPAPAADMETSESRRRAVLAALGDGRSLQGWDLTGVDLSAADLRGADLRGALLESALLSGADLRGADLTEAVLAHADLSGASLGGACLRDASLGRASLRECVSDGGLVLDGATLYEADLGGARLPSSSLRRSDLSGARFEATDLSGSEAELLLLYESDLRGLQLRGARLYKCVLLRCELSGLDLSETDLSSTVFVECRATGSLFRGATAPSLRFVMGCTLDGADFEGAELRMANFRGSSLRGASFREARLGQADLSDCDLREADLHHAWARGARLIKADLRGASLRAADLLDALLQKADLRSTDLREACLFQADLAQIHADQGTALDGANVLRARHLPLRRAEREELA